MGEVYRPEDLARRRRKPVDLIPKRVTQPITLAELEEISRDIGSIKSELTKIKMALKAHGIEIE